MIKTLSLLLRGINMHDLSLGEKISILRNRKKYSKKALGELTGIHWGTISRYEQNKLAPSIDAIKKLAVALDISTDYLLLDKESPDIKDKELLDLTEKADHLPDKDKDKVKSILKSLVEE